MQRPLRQVLVDDRNEAVVVMLLDEMRHFVDDDTRVGQAVP
jgi:hypothetical protein